MKLEERLDRARRAQEQREQRQSRLYARNAAKEYQKELDARSDIGPATDSQDDEDHGLRPKDA